MTQAFLRGTIALILDEQRLLINLGKEDGVAIGDKFIIFEDGQEVTDPATNQSLGKLELIKAQVEAVHVQEKLSLVMPIKKETTTQTNVLSAVLAKTSSTSSIAPDIYREKLDVKIDQVSGLAQINSVIAVGDKVRSI